MGLRFPVATSEAFREWLRLWRRFYFEVFSLRYNFQPLRGQPLPHAPDDFCWPIVVGGRGEMELRKLCVKHRRPSIVLKRENRLKKAMSNERLVSMRVPNEYSYVVWVRDPRQPNNCLIGVDCRQLSRQHDTTTVEEEVLLRLFLRFYQETPWQPAVLLCTDSWIEGQSVEMPSGKFWPAVQCFPAFISAGKNGLVQLISLPPRAIGAAREVFIP